MPRSDYPSNDFTSLSDSVVHERRTPWDYDAMFGCLAHCRRCLLIEITTDILHNHLPKLEDARILDVDFGTNTVRGGPRFDVATALLAVV